MGKLSAKRLNFKEKIIVNYRWVLVMFCLLPLSIWYNLFMMIRRWIIRVKRSAPLLHDARVQNVQAQVREWNRNGRVKQMCTARPNWLNVSFRPARYKKQLQRIKVNLMDILDVDIGKKIVRVEPQVTMGQLTARLSPMGWSVEVIPELDQLTIGGLVCGEGIETTSHKHGLFQNIVVSCDVVLPDGSLAHCSKDENPDLFYAIPWSHGTLGFLVCCEIRIMPIRKYIKLEYIPVYSHDEMVTVFTEATERDGDNEFVESLVFSESTAVVMIGNMTDVPEKKKINSIGRFYKPWFYKHVEGFLTNGQDVEYIPFRDYCHRHSKSIFWEMEDIISFGNHPVFRWVFGCCIPPKISLLKLTSTKTVQKLYDEHQAIQDIIVPLSTCSQLLKYIHQEFQVYPLWVCPCLIHNVPGMIHPTDEKEKEFFIDIGIYGTPMSDQWNCVHSIKNLEKYCRDVKGYQMLYATVLQDEEEFREMFDHTLYDTVRKKYGANDAFPEVFNKVCFNS